MPQLYLASRSPRRAELLRQIGAAFERLNVEVPEHREAGEAPEVYALRLALAKSRAGRADAPGDIPVLGADTAVVLDGEPLGKPRDRDDGIAMLRRLSGRTHQVLTGVALSGADGRELSRLSVSQVTFRELDLAEIEGYWRTGEPADKAGSYAIQGLGAVFVQRLEGSYSGVVGLPLYETDELLRVFGVRLLAARS